VPNIPGIVPKTASQALNEATHNYIELIANHGFESCLINNKEIFNAVNTYKGKLTSKPVSESLDLNYNSLDKIIK
jgi:alanine dehydrogenase